jgi:hypothetical protein
MDRTLVLVSACEARRSRRRTVAGPRIARKGSLRTDGQPPIHGRAPRPERVMCGESAAAIPTPGSIAPQTLVRRGEPVCSPQGRHTNLPTIVGARRAVPGVGATGWSPSTGVRRVCSGGWA